jgi:hypothetical protein
VKRRLIWHALSVLVKSGALAAQPRVARIASQRIVRVALRALFVVRRLWVLPWSNGLRVGLTWPPPFRVSRSCQFTSSPAKPLLLMDRGRRFLRTTLTRSLIDAPTNEPEKRGRGTEYSLSCAA